MASLDICICTFNRSSYLKRCLDTLLSQIQGSQVGIIIVDNASMDDTRSLLQQYAHHAFVRIVEENIPGLSHARNRGWKESNADWILYIDDDCLPRPDFIHNALAIIAQQPSEVAIGGPVFALFENTPPEWLPTGLGQFTMPYEAYTPIAKGYIRGGCMMIKRNFFQIHEGFDIQLGVSGKKLRFGEEIELQERMRKLGETIAYAPSLAIDHFVRPEKISTFWILHAEYARRRDKMKISPLPVVPLTVKLGLTFIKTLVIFPANWTRSLLDKRYTKQKASLDSFLPLMYRTGEWWGAINRSKKNAD